MVTTYLISATFGFKDTAADRFGPSARHDTSACGDRSTGPATDVRDRSVCACGCVRLLIAKVFAILSGHWVQMADVHATRSWKVWFWKLVLVRADYGFSIRASVVQVRASLVLNLLWSFIAVLLQHSRWQRRCPLHARHLDRILLPWRHVRRGLCQTPGRRGASCEFQQRSELQRDGLALENIPRGLGNQS
jgi:hypothetical protein